MSSECSTGNIPPGYKQTEVGVLPEDWEVKPMAELFTFQNGVNADKSSYGRGTPFINVLEVITHSTITETRIPGKISLSAEAISAFEVQHGDILFNRTSETQEEVGLTSVYIGNEVVVFGGFVIRARPKDNSLDSIFTSYVLRSPTIRSQIVARGQGAVRANIGQQDLSRVLVVLPTKAEQRAIAEAISDADALIESLEQLIAKKRQIKQGAMQELLTGKRRLPGFEIKQGYKQTDAGLIPEDWEVSSLRKCCCKITDGTHDTPKPVRLGIPFLTAIHVKDNWIDFDSCLYVTEADHKIIFSRCNPEKNDVLMVNIGMGVATTALVNVDYEFSLKNVALLKPESRRTIGSYINYSIAQMKQKITQDLSSGGAQPFLSLTQIGEITIPLPATKAEQEAIAYILSDMDSEITALEKKLAKARQIKQGMMQELLTGRVRLI